MKRKKKLVNKETKTYKKKEIRKLKNKLLKAWALRVKENAGFKCELCGFPGDEKLKLNSHHIEDKKTNAFLRYEPRNGLCVDAGCHSFTKNAVHRSFITLYKYMTEKRKDDLVYLLENYENHVEVTKEFLEEKLKEFGGV